MRTYKRNVPIQVVRLWRKWINENLFGAFLYTVWATSKTEHEPQGGEKSERRA